MESEVDRLRESEAQLKSENVILTELCRQPEGEELDKIVKETLDLLPRYVRNLAETSITTQVEERAFKIQKINIAVLTAVAPLIKPIIRLKSIVHCVRFCVRYNRAISTKQIELLGERGLITACIERILLWP